MDVITYRIIPINNLDAVDIIREHHSNCFIKKKQNLQYILGLSNTEKSYCKFYFKIKELNGLRNWESKVCNTMQAQVFTNQVKIFTYIYALLNYNPDFKTYPYSHLFLLFFLSLLGYFIVKFSSTIF